MYKILTSGIGFRYLLFFFQLANIWKVLCDAEEAPSVPFVSYP